MSSMVFERIKGHFSKAPECGYVRHAKREFLAMGYKPIEECEDDPNKWIQENVLELLTVLGAQGHSGFSIEYVVDYFSKLAKFEPLCPLSGDDAEWNNTDPETWQNNRCSRVFKSPGGQAYDIDGYVFWHWSERPLEADEEGFPGISRFKSCFTSSMSRKLVTFPYSPTKPVYVEVDSFEVNKETGEREPGSDWWETIYPEWLVREQAGVSAAIGRV